MGLKHAGPARPGRTNQVRPNRAAIDHDHRLGVAAELRHPVVNNTESIVFDEDDSQANWYGWAIFPSYMDHNKIQGSAIGNRPSEKRKPGKR